MTGYIKPHAAATTPNSGSAPGHPKPKRRSQSAGHDVTHQECFGRFTVLALSLNAAIRKCMRRVARMCADCSAREQLDHQEGARA